MKLKQLIKEIKIYESDSMIRPTDKELKVASDFAKKKNASIAGVGVDEKTGNIHVSLSRKSGSIRAVDVILDKRGNVVDIELPF